MLWNEQQNKEALQKTFLQCFNSKWEILLGKLRSSPCFFLNKFKEKTYIVLYKKR